MGPRLATLVIASVLGVQAFAVIDPLTTRFFPEPGYFWPFLDCPMYRTAHRAGEPIDRFVVIGILNNGSEIRIEPADVQLTFQQYWGFVDAIKGGRRADIRTYLGLHKQIHATTVAGVRLENHAVYLSKEPAPRRVITTVVMRGES